LILSSFSIVSMTTAMAIPDTSREGEQAAEFTHPTLLFPATEGALVQCLVKIKRGEDTGHLVEVVICLTEILLQFDTQNNQPGLNPLVYPLGAGMSGPSTFCLAIF
jgi:hypothetical protein